MSQSSIKVTNIKSNFLFTWIFKHLRETKSPKLCELTQELKFDDPLKDLQAEWGKEKLKPKPSQRRESGSLWLD